jgi:alcohol dehydrogenase class IV
VAAACIETDPSPYASLAAAAGLPVQGLDPGAAAGLLLGRIKELSRAIGIPERLSDLGLPRDRLPAVLADALAYRNRASSPRAFTDAELALLLERMF